MAATITTLDLVLKNFYAAAVAEQLNQEVLMLELFEKAKLDWSGKKVVVPVHVARNSGVGFAAEGAALPTAGNQTYEELNITAKFLYGRFQVSGPAISSAKGAYSFGNYIDLELRKLVEDVRKTANIATFSGNIVAGYGQKRQNVGGGAAFTTPFSGDIVELERKRAAAVAAGGALTVTIRRTDNYAAVANGTGLTLASTDASAHTITITAGGAGLDTREATVGQADGSAYSIEIDGDAAALASAQLEVAGIATNLSSGSHFGLSRVTGNGTALRCEAIRTQATGGAGDDANYDDFANLSLQRMQNIVDEVSAASGLEPDVIMMNPAQRASYTGLLVGSSAGNLYVQAEKATSGDGGFTGLFFNSIPIRSSVDAGKHMLYFLHTKVWKLAELEKPGFADLDGNILARAGVGSGGIDAYEGYYRMYCDVYCERPNANGALIGVSF